MSQDGIRHFSHFLPFREVDKSQVVRQVIRVRRLGLYDIRKRFRYFYHIGQINAYVYREKNIAKSAKVSFTNIR